MVDYCYGISNKKIYFPKSDWKINGKVLTNHFHPLQPDSIMLCNGELFILDSKYYQFGVSLKIDDLPSTSDVSKQVVYGKYARKKFSGKVFNAFILPFNATTSNSSPMQACGETMISPYFEFQPSESRVKLVLVDTRMLMENYSLRKKGNIKELAKTIKSDV